MYGSELRAVELLGLELSFERVEYRGVSGVQQVHRSIRPEASTLEARNP